MILQPLNTDVKLLNTILNLGLRDGLSKMKVLELLQAYKFLPADFDVAAAVDEVGADWRMEPVGAMGLHVQPMS